MKNFLKKLFWRAITFLWVGLAFAAVVQRNNSKLELSQFRMLFTSNGTTTGTKVMDINTWGKVIIYWPLEDGSGNSYITGWAIGATGAMGDTGAMWATWTMWMTWVVDTGWFYTTWQINTLLLGYVAMSSTGNWDITYNRLQSNSGNALYFLDNSWSYLTVVNYNLNMFWYITWWALSWYLTSDTGDFWVEITWGIQYTGWNIITNGFMAKWNWVTASGDNATAMWYHTNAAGTNSTAIWNNTTTNANNSTVLGINNEWLTWAIFEIWIWSMGPLNAMTVLASNGYVGLWTSAPNYQLDVVGTGRFDELCLWVSCITARPTFSTGSFLTFGNIDTGFNFTGSDTIFPSEQAIYNHFTGVTTTIIYQINLLTTGTLNFVNGLLVSTGS
jgi:hypothetical protein